MTTNKRYTLTLIIAIAAFLLIVMAVTCPNKDDHKEAINNAFKEYFNNKVEPSNDTQEALMSAFALLLTDGIVNIVIDYNLQVDNYLFFSIGKITDGEGNRKSISIGLLNHVFTINKDDIAKALNDE